MPTKIQIDFSTIPEEIPYYPWEIMLEQGFHWMDRYGNGYWIDDMSLDYLQNALRFARHACRMQSNAWWGFAMRLNGDMAIDQAEREASRWDEEDVPLIKGLENAIAKKEGRQKPYEQYELVDSSMAAMLRNMGYRHMRFLQEIHSKGLYSTHSRR